MSELAETVSDQPTPVQSRPRDWAALALRVVILAVVIAGASTTYRGLHDAWDHGVPTDGRFGWFTQELWGFLPYGLIVLIAAFKISKRSLATLLVTSLLAWFMSTDYWNLDEMGMVVFIIPFIQLIFVAAALVVMFTFWLLRTRKS